MRVIWPEYQQLIKINYSEFETEYDTHPNIHIFLLISRCSNVLIGYRGLPKMQKKDIVNVYIRNVKNPKNPKI